jgi:hypothetical protein
LFISITITYGVNSTLKTYLNIIACLCINTSYCDYSETATISAYYELASCDCPSQYDGIL